jgi:hypothetical protein
MANDDFKFDSQKAERRVNDLVKHNYQKQKPIKAILFTREDQDVLVLSDGSMYQKVLF